MTKLSPPEITEQEPLQVPDTLFEILDESIRNVLKSLVKPSTADILRLLQEYVPERKFIPAGDLKVGHTLVLRHKRRKGQKGVPPIRLRHPIKDIQYCQPKWPEKGIHVDSRYCYNDLLVTVEIEP